MIYPNQKQAGNEILHTFRKYSKYVVLVAQMQSGKTGTCKYVIKNMIKKFGILAEECWYICGMNDNDLLYQAQREFRRYIPKSNILFSKGLQKHNHENIKIRPPKVIIVDESHYAGYINSQVDIFLETHYSEELYLISVSATPMAEISSVKEYNKKVIILKPADGYYGITNIFEEELIFQAANINTSFEEFANDIISEYERQRETKSWKYCIVRLPNQWYTSDMEADLGLFCSDINFINCHYSYEEDIKLADFNDYIKTKPPKMTIIWIYNSLRAGKQLDTKNIGLVYDSGNSGTDTTAQALLGRILGYNKKEHKVRCFTDIESAKRMLTWIQTDFSDKHIPLKSRGVLNKSICANNWILHVPVLISLNPEYISAFRLLKEKYNNRYPYKDKLRAGILASTTCAEDEVFISNIFRNYRDGKYGGLMILSENNADRSFREHWEGNYTNYINKRLIRGFEVGAEQISEEYNKFCYIFVNLHKYSKQYGDCLIVYKEYKNTEDGDISGNSEEDLFTSLKTHSKTSSLSRFT